MSTEAEADSGILSAAQGSSSQSFDKEFDSTPTPNLAYCPKADDSVPQRAPLDPYYDCGRDAWLTLAGTWMVQFCTYGYISAFGIYQDYYTRIFLNETTPSNISWIGSFQLFMQYAPGILVGRAFDGGYFHQMMLVGSFIQILSMLMLSLAHQDQYYQVFLAQAVGMGLGQSMLFLPSLAIIGHHFKRRRALATGLAVSGASVGGLVWPILLNHLNKYTTFANSIRATAAVAATLLIFANILMKSKPHKASVTARPTFTFILRDSAYLISIASAFCINLGLFFPYFYLQLYAVDLGIEKSLAFYSVTMLNAGSVLGRVLPNFFADHVGPYNMLIPCLFVSSALVFVMLAISNFGGVVPFGLLYGFWSGSYVSLIPSLLARFSTHPREHGMRMGFAFSVVGISLLVGTPIEGALLHGREGDYLWYRPILFCGIMVVCGALGMTLSRVLFVSQGRSGDRGWRV